MKNDNHLNEQDEPTLNSLDSMIYKVGNVLSLLFIFTVAISFFEVLMRYAFNAPTSWVHETASFVGGALFVFGGAYALATDKHVRVVLVYDIVSQRTRHYLNMFHHLMGLLMSAMLIFASYRMVSSAWFSPLGDIHLETSGSAWNPSFPAYIKALILFTACLMFVQFLLHIKAEIIKIRKL
ncbi:TRAP transporter small permease subunit [Marinomonas algicola]|jgi:TRAP-type mannitol/chloroaromatic compound transport system permease small subunit|uniref:TRAP transporter small permease subunit n=1 Tax=Marinomonas algicola TaxID=2773454 RepID=UPI001749A53B|nr:TRAP transporter small permease subunit [Marinomonas algicola]